MERIGSSGKSRRVRPAVVAASVIASVLLASLVTFLLVFFLAVRPAEKEECKKSGSVVKVQQRKPPARPPAAAGAAAVEKALVGDLEKGVYEAIVDDIIDSKGLGSLISGISVKPTPTFTGTRTRPMMGGEAPKLTKTGRMAATGADTEDWLDKLDASGTKVRGPDGVVRPMSEADKPRLGTRELFKAMIKSRSSRSVPSALEGWDSSDLIPDTTDGGKMRSREEMDRFSRRVAIAAAQEKDMFPEGLSPLVGPTNPFFEDLKSRIV